MRIMTAFGALCVACACESGPGVQDSGSMTTLRTGDAFAVVRGADPDGLIYIDGNYYSRASRTETLEIAIKRGLFASQAEAEKVFADRSYEDLYSTISEALAIEGAFASAAELRFDIEAGMTGAELRRKYLPASRTAER